MVPFQGCLQNDGQTWVSDEIGDGVPVELAIEGLLGVGESTAQPARCDERARVVATAFDNLTISLELAYQPSDRRGTVGSQR